MADITEEDLKVFMKNDFELLNAQLEKWYGRLMAHDSVIVAIARKAPRLLCYCKLKFPHLYNPNVVAVSDIAVPFIKWENAKKHCLVIDEAIYHGTTFGKVLRVVKNAVNGKDVDVRGLPWVVTQDALGNPDIVDSLVDGWNLIGNDNCNFFIDTVISKFFELGKPYDIEYPLFYVSLPEGRYDKTEIDGIIEKVLKLLAADEASRFHTQPIYFKNTNYRREDQRTFSAFTYCTDYVYQDSHDGAKPDFSKLRIFHDDRTICIASMAPYAINEHTLAYDQSLFCGALRQVLNLVRDALRETSEDNQLACHQEQKSLSIMLNYLLSVNHFLRFKKKLSRLFAAILGYDVDFYLKSGDLQWLVGQDLASVLQKALVSLGEYEEIEDVYKDLGTVKSLIPMMYKDDYLLQLTLDNMYDKTSASSVISNIFSDLHWIVEVKSRRLPREAYDRLEFGESLSSIQEMCANLIPYNSTESIHSNVDMRIDRGSMVPDYVCVNDVVNSYWKRMFRSGENEDLMRDQHFRICINVLNQYLRKIHTTSISSDELRLLFALLVEVDDIFKEASSNSYNSIFATQMSVCYENGEYRIFVVQNDEKSDLLKKLCDYHVISEIELDGYELASSSYVNLLSNALPLSDKQIQRVNSIIDFVAYAHKNCDEPTVCELKNYACFSEATLEKAYQDWKKGVESFILVKSRDDFDDLTGTFADLYLAVPEPRNCFSDNLFASSSVGTWMKNFKVTQDVGFMTQTMLDKLHAVFYMMNLWNKLNGKEISGYYDAGMYAGFNTLMSLYRRTEDNECPVILALSQCGPKMNVDGLLNNKADVQDALCRLLALI